MTSNGSSFRVIAPNEPAVVFLVDEIMRLETPPSGAFVNVFSVDGGTITTTI